MSSEKTIQTIDRDVRRELRINNYIGLMNKSELININRNIIGSTMLFSDNIRKLNNTVYSSFDNQTRVLSGQLNNITHALLSIESNIVAVKEIMKQQTHILNSTLEKLDEIHDTLKHPSEVESKEQFERGVQWMEKGFLTEAAEAFILSLEKNPTNYLSHLYLGILYLCGKDEENDIIDFEKAENELKLALRYSRPDEENELVKQYIILIHQNLSDLYYATASIGQDSASCYARAFKELQCALEIDDSEMTQACLSSRLIKCANKLGDTEKVIEYARIGLLNDNSLLALLCDDDFSALHSQFIEIICESIPILKKRVIDMLVDSEAFDDRGCKGEFLKKFSDEDFNTYTAISIIYNEIRGMDHVPVKEAYDIFFNPVKYNDNPFSVSYDFKQLYDKLTNKGDVKKSYYLNEDSIRELVYAGKPVLSNLSYDVANQIKKKLNDEFLFLPMIRFTNYKGINDLLGDYLLMKKLSGTEDQLSFKLNQISNYISNTKIGLTICEDPDSLFLKLVSDDRILSDTVCDACKKEIGDYYYACKELFEKHKGRHVNDWFHYNYTVDSIIDYSSRSFVLPNGSSVNCMDLGYDDISAKSITSIRDDSRNKKIEQEEEIKEQRKRDDRKGCASTAIVLIVSFAIIVLVVRFLNRL